MTNRTAAVPKNTVLVAAHIESSFPELFSLARLLQGSSDFRPVFLFDRSGFYSEDKMVRDADRCLDEGIEVRGYRKAGESPLGQLHKLAGASRNSTIYGLLKKSYRYLELCFPWQLQREYRAYAAAKKVIQECHAAILVLGLDLAHYPTAAYIKAAHKLGIPAVIVTDMMAEPNEFGDVYYNHPRHSMKRISNAVIGRLFPAWTMEYRGRRLLRLPSAGKVLAKELLGLAPPMPWQLHSGHADALLLESERVRDVALRNGLAASAIKVTGLSSHDVMFEVFQHKTDRLKSLYQTLGFSGDKEMILLALPQDDQPAGLALPFPSYREMVAFIVATLAQCADYHTVVCLHPSTSVEDVRFIEESGARISTLPTYALIPLCKIYVATISSTIKWAILSAIPVVAYDYNRQGKSDYADAGGVVTVQHRRDFRDTVLKLARDPEYYRLMQEKQKRCAGHWGRPDGQAGTRILGLFHQITLKSPKG